MNMSVSLSVHVSQKPHGQSYQLLCMLRVSVAQFDRGDVSFVDDVTF